MSTIVFLKYFLTSKVKRTGIENLRFCKRIFIFNLKNIKEHNETTCTAIGCNENTLGFRYIFTYSTTCICTSTVLILMEYG